MKITKPFQYSEVVNKGRVSFYGDSIDDLVEQVSRIRRKNGVYVPEYNAMFNHIKAKASGSVQVDGVGSKSYERQLKNGKDHNPTRSRSVSIQDAARAAKAMMKIVPGDYVSEEEYKRRLKICSMCPLKQKNSDCMGCGGAGKAARILMSFRSMIGLGYKLDKGVGSQFCGFCGCSLSLLLVTKVSNYKKEDENLNNQRPNPCWLKKESINYVG